MNTRFRGAALLAAVALGGSSLVATAPSALAAPSQETAKLCTPGYQGSSTSEPKCSISALGTITEGQTVSTTVTGSPNTTVQVRAYAIVDGKLLPVGPAASAQTGSTGLGGSAVAVKVDPLKAPVNGGYRVFTVQAADLPTGTPVTSPDLVVGRGTNSNITHFSVHSARPQISKWSSQSNIAPGSEQFTILNYGIQGQAFAVQVMVNGQWQTLNKAGDTGNVMTSSSATVRWIGPNLAAGTYGLRVQNLTTNETVWSGQMVFGGGTPPPPANPPAPGQPKPNPPQPAPKPAKDKDSSGGLAKTGL